MGSTASHPSPTGLGWIAIIRLGLVQAAIGAIVMLATSLLNRVMVVEYALAAAVPAGLVAWHYAVQLARPLWGHGSDRGRRRTPWIVGGMAMLAGGALLAVRATVMLPDSALLGGALAIAGLDGCERAPDEDALPYVEQPEGEVPGVARLYATAVEMDGVAQPVMGKTRMARPIKLEGNMRHPASGGATDAFTQAALLGLYDPERSKAPLFKGDETDWARVDAAMAGLRATFDRTGGAGLRLVTGPVGSPTLLRQIGDMLARWPQARWHIWSPLPRRTRALRLESAQVVVALDDDLIGAGPFQTYHAKGWGERRRGYQAGDGSALLFVAEPSPTITGVTATDRLVAREDRIGALIAALESRIDTGRMPAGLNSREADWIETVAAALERHRGAGRLALGAHHPAALHRAVRRIGALLGHAEAEEDRGVAQDLSALIAEMEGGAVQALMMLDVNPVFANPGFAAAMAKVVCSPAV